MARVADRLARIEEDLVEIISERDAATRVVAKLKARSKAARKRAKQTRADYSASIDELQERISAAINRGDKVTHERNQALNDAKEFKKKLEVCAARIRDADIELRVLRGRAGLPVEQTVLGASWSLISVRSAILAVCARLGMKPEYPSATPLRSKEVPSLLGVSLSNDDAYIRAMFTIEERVGKIIDASKEALAAFDDAVDEVPTAWIAKLRDAVYGPTP